MFGWPEVIAMFERLQEEYDMYTTEHSGTTPSGVQYTSVLHPDNSLHLSKFGEH